MQLVVHHTTASDIRIPLECFLTFSSYVSMTESKWSVQWHSKGVISMNGECSATGKCRYATARAAHTAVKQSYWGRHTKKQPLRVYYCKQCQGYHLSSNGNIWKRRERLQRKDNRTGPPNLSDHEHRRELANCPRRNAQVLNSLVDWLKEAS